MKKLLFMLLCVAMFACNEAKVNVDEPDISIGIQIVQSDVKAGGYDRGFAPVYIKGLDVSVTNSSNPVGNQSKSFEFVEHGNTGGLPMVINKLKPGSNKFMCTTMNQYDPLIKDYSVLRIPETDIDDNPYNTVEVADNFVDRAHHYSLYLDKEQPLFMRFYECQPKELGLSNNPYIHFDLKALFFRLNVVLECIKEYDAKLIIQSKSSYIESEFMASGPDAVAIVLNDENVTEGRYYEVIVEIYDKAGKYLGYKYVEPLTFDNGTKATRVYRYDGSELLSGTFTAVYQPIVEDNSGEGL